MVEVGSRISDSDSADEIDHTRGRMRMRIWGWIGGEREVPNTRP